MLRNTKKIGTRERQKHWWIISNLIKKHKGCCVACKVQVTLKFTEPLENSYATIDHVVSLSKGGTDNLNNLSLMCYKCNMAKGNKTEEEFMSEYFQTKEEK